MDAPVCHVSVDQQFDQPTARTLPAIPHATDLDSALAAINAMRQILDAMLERFGSSGGPNTPGTGGASSGPAKKQQEKQGRWQEVNRATKDVKVPIDDTSDPPTVTIKRTNSITMRDTITGQVLTIRG